MRLIGKNPNIIHAETAFKLLSLTMIAGLINIALIGNYFAQKYGWFGYSAKKEQTEIPDWITRYPDFQRTFMISCMVTANSIPVRDDYATSAPEVGRLNKGDIFQIQVGPKGNMFDKDNLYTVFFRTASGTYIPAVVKRDENFVPEITCPIIYQNGTGYEVTTGVIEKLVQDGY